MTHGIDELHMIAHVAGVPLVTVVFPLFVDLGDYRLAPVHEIVSASWRAWQCHTYDLLPLYATMFRRHGPTFILNALHPNPLGHRLAALYLRRVLQRDQLLPPLAAAGASDRELSELDARLEPVIAGSLAR